MSNLFANAFPKVVLFTNNSTPFANLDLFDLIFCRSSYVASSNSSFPLISLIKGKLLVK